MEVLTPEELKDLNDKAIDADKRCLLAIKSYYKDKARFEKLMIELAPDFDEPKLVSEPKKVIFSYNKFNNEEVFDLLSVLQKNKELLKKTPHYYDYYVTYYDRMFKELLDSYSTSNYHLDYIGMLYDFQQCVAVCKLSVTDRGNFYKNNKPASSTGSPKSPSPSPKSRSSSPGVTAATVTYPFFDLLRPLEQNDTILKFDTAIKDDKKFKQIVLDGDFIPTDNDNKKYILDKALELAATKFDWALVEPLKFILATKDKKKIDISSKKQLVFLCTLVVLSPITEKTSFVLLMSEIVRKSLGKTPVVDNTSTITIKKDFDTFEQFFDYYGPLLDPIKPT